MLVLNDMTADARVMREASALTAAGYSVTVLALRGDGLPDKQQQDGFEILRVAKSTTAGWGRPWLKLRQLRDRAVALTEAATALQPDVVHAHDADTLVAAHDAAMACGAKLVFDAHELYSDMISEHGLSGSWLVQLYWKRIEDRLIPRADAVITVSTALGDELGRRHSVSPVVVANVPDLVPLVSSTRLRDEMGIGQAVPVVLYQGGFIRGRSLERLVRSMASVPDAVLAMQGWGPLEGELRRVAREAGVHDRVHFLGKAHPGELHEYACGADVGVVIYERTTLNNYLAAPNKLYAYMMAGLPVVSSDFPGLAGIVEGEGIGATFDPASDDSIAAAVRTLLDDPSVRESMGVRARHLAETCYNWDVGKEALLAVYQTLGGGR